MDLTARKYKFIERFMQLANAEKLQQLENVLFSDVVNDNTVIYDIKGEGISKQEYIQRNADAVTSYKQGRFKTSAELKNKFLSK